MTVINKARQISSSLVMSRPWNGNFNQTLRKTSESINLLRVLSSLKCYQTNKPARHPLELYSRKNRELDDGDSVYILTCFCHLASCKYILRAREIFWLRKLTVFNTNYFFVIARHTVWSTVIQYEVLAGTGQTWHTSGVECSFRSIYGVPLKQSE